MKAFATCVQESDSVIIVGVFKSHTDAVDAAQKEHGVDPLQWNGNSNYMYADFMDKRFSVRPVQVK